MAKKSGIRIKPENRGKFTAKAKRAGMGVRGRVIPERRARHLEQHLVEWQ